MKYLVLNISLLTGLFLGIPAGAQEGADPLRQAPEKPEPLTLERPAAALSSPQAVGTKEIVWTVAARGGRGRKIYTFFLKKEGEGEAPVQTAGADRWRWVPEEPGVYRVRAAVRDASGMSARSDWSAPFRIHPPLQAESPEAAVRSPQTAGFAIIPWEVEASGGVGDLSYEFLLSVNGSQPQSVWKGTSPHWVWKPQGPGGYRVKVRVWDSLGNKVGTRWSSLYRIAPPLRLLGFGTQAPDPQTPEVGTVRWSAEASGGIGRPTYSFWISKDGEDPVMQQQAHSPDWDWTPQEPGNYRIQAVVSDFRGNEVRSEWVSFRIVPSLKCEELVSNLSPPQAARSASVRWSAEVSGGVPGFIYEFHLKRDGEEGRVARTGAEPHWQWTPQEAGDYAVRVIVSDLRGNRAESPWSAPYRVEPRLEVTTPGSSKESPQALQTTRVVWRAEGSGGVGGYSYSFELSREGAPAGLYEMEDAPEWVWSPSSSGIYRVRAILRDALGNTARSGWSDPFEITAPLEVTRFKPDRKAPQAAASTEITWEVDARGGVGELKKTVLLHETGSGRESAFELGTSSIWAWRPDTPGQYRLNVRVTDALGNTAHLQEDFEYSIAPALTVVKLRPRTPLPPPFPGRSITWETEVRGGVGAYRFEFLLRRGNGVEEIAQEGTEPRWIWTPRQEGLYRIQIRVSDGLGNQAQSPWSEEYQVGIRKLAVLPVLNVSGSAVPETEITAMLRDEISGRGIEVLEEGLVQEFLRKYRIRNTGMIDGAVARKIRTETGGDAVLLTSVELYHDGKVPKIALTSRLVTTGEPPQILWMDGLGLTGMDHPGLLNLGVVEQVQDLVARAVAHQADSLRDFFTEEDYRRRDQVKRTRTIRPKILFLKKEEFNQGNMKAAVLPFLNRSDRKHAEKNVEIHLIKALFNQPGIQIIEPGVIYNLLYKYRMTFPQGFSVADSSLIFAQTDADVILTGVVDQFNDAIGDQAPSVDFSIRATKKGAGTIWESRSYNRGDDGVFFYDLGKVKTAYGLVDDALLGTTDLLN